MMITLLRDMDAMPSRSLIDIDLVRLSHMQALIESTRDLEGVAKELADVRKNIASLEEKKLFFLRRSNELQRRWDQVYQVYQASLIDDILR